MKNIILKLIARFAGAPDIDPLFLMRMRSVDRSLRYAVSTYSFERLEAAHDRVMWEYQFNRSKEELDLICDMLGRYEQCKTAISRNLQIECGL